MFRGRYEHTLDSKGRLSIPVKFREILSGEGNGRLVITTFDDCLIAYPYQEWCVLEERIAALPEFKEWHFDTSKAATNLMQASSGNFETLYMPPGFSDGRPGSYGKRRSRDPWGKRYFQPRAIVEFGAPARASG